MVMGLQSLQFYSFVAWVPTLFVDQGRSPAEAGLLLSLSGVSSLATSAITPVIATRRSTQFHVVAALIVLWVVGYVGLLIDAGTLAPLWMVLIGLGQGVGISLGLTLITLRSPDAAHTSELSGMAQGVGYVIAAIGPFALGAIHDLSGGWTWPVITLIVLLVPLGLAGLGAARNRYVGGTGNGTVLTSDVREEPLAHPDDARPDERPGLVGQVRSADGRPLEGATVTLVDDAGRQLDRTSTDAGGAYALSPPDVPALLVCAAPEHTPVAHRAAGGRHDVELSPREATEPIG